MPYTSMLKSKSTTDHRDMLRLIQRAFPVNYVDPSDLTGLSDRVALYETARRIRNADYQKEMRQANGNA